LLEEPRNTSRDVINFIEEKEYMPKILRGVAKQSAPFVRKIKVSPDSQFRRNGDTEKKPFCIVYNKNGSEQEFNYSEILSFVDYAFNLRDVIYFKILPQNLKSNLPIATRYTKAGESKDEAEKLLKFRSIALRVAGW
jgi:hypothetical protein